MVAMIVDCYINLVQTSGVSHQLSDVGTALSRMMRLTLWIKQGHRVDGKLTGTKQFVVRRST